jgi:proline iminopeptidase
MTRSAFRRSPANRSSQITLLRNWRLALLVAIMGLMTAPSFAQSAEDAEFVVDRPRAQAIIGNLRKITSDNGVEEIKSVSLGGIEQWISVRGRNRENPVLLFIHGGPAVPEMPTSWFYQASWEDYFTVVQWDQRGAGKTMASSDPDTLAQGLSVEKFVSDAEELTTYLRQAYGKEKIFVLGHSWGSIIGLKLALRRPDWLHAYVGMGQAIDFQENERLGTEFALQSAEKTGNEEALAELKSILPYPEPDKPLIVEKILVQRKWLTHFGGMVWNRSDFSFQEGAAVLSPDYSKQDIAASAYAGITAMTILPELVSLSFLDVTKVDCPVFIFAGEHDFATSSELVHRWFAALEAPEKHLMSFAGVSHELQFEAPGKLLFHLVADVRPLAIAAGDGAPAR